MTAINFSIKKNPAKITRKFLKKALWDSSGPDAPQKVQLGQLHQCREGEIQGFRHSSSGGHGSPPLVGMWDEGDTQREM